MKYEVHYLTDVFGDAGWDSYDMLADAETAAEEFAAGLAAAYPDPAAGWDGWERKNGVITVNGVRHLPPPSDCDEATRRFWDSLEWETVEDVEDDDYEGETGVFAISEAAWRAAIDHHAVWIELA